MNLQDSIKEFCNKEYAHSSFNPNKELVLNPADCGGYDITGEVKMKFEGDEAILTFDGTWDERFPLTHAVYRFKLIS